MNIKFNHTQKFLAFAFILFFYTALSACGSSQALSGGAGLGNAQPTEAPVVEAPIGDVLAAIPETYGHIIYVSNRDGQMNLYITTPDGLEQNRLTLSNSEDITPRLSPDGTRVAFVSTVDGNMDIYVLDIASRVLTRVTDAPEKDSAPSWSFDGSLLAFESFRDGNFEIYIANADGSNQIRLTNDPAGDNAPVWSPVTNEIVFVSNRFGNADILLLTQNGGVSTLTTNRAPDSAPDWSPDGSMIAYKSSAGDLADICIIARDGINQRCLSATPSEYSAPIWSPDGNFLAVNGKQNNGYGVNVFNVADGSLTQLSAPGVDPRGTPFWSPEGARLVFQAQVDGNMELFTVLVPTNEFTRLTSIAAYDGEPIWSQQ